MATNNVRAAIALAKAVVSQEPPGVKAGNWDEWQAWKTKADQAEQQLARAIESVNSRSLDEDTLSSLAEVQQGIKHGRSGYRVSETAVSMLPQPEPVVKSEPVNGSISAPQANGSKISSAKIVYFEPACDNCHKAGINHCVRSPPPSHRRCIRCGDENLRCSFKLAKASLAAAAIAASESSGKTDGQRGKRKRASGDDEFTGSASAPPRALRREVRPARVKSSGSADIEYLGGGGRDSIRKSVEDAKNLIKTATHLLEQVEKALDGIAEESKSL